MSSPPTAYVRQADFTGFSSAHPDEQQNGVDLDDEFNALKLTIDSLISRLGQIQRSDGLLTNQIVTPDSLSSNVLAFFTALGSAPRGNWLTGTAYVVRDLTVQGGAVYICALAHTSGVFATDLAAGKWQVLSNVAGNQSLNTTDNVQFANLTLTGAASFGSTLAVTGISTLTGYTKIGTANAATNSEKLRVGGDVFLEKGIHFNGLQRKITVKKTNQTSGVNVDLFTIHNEAILPGCAVVKLRIWIFNTDVQSNYVVGYYEYPIFCVNTGAADVSVVGTAIFSQVRSQNAGVINISSMVPAVSVSGDSNNIYLTVSLSGSGSSTKFTVYAEAESMGDNGPLIVPVP